MPNACGGKPIYNYRANGFDVVQSRAPGACLPITASRVWAFTSVFDPCATEQLKCPTVFDDFALVCLAFDVAGSIRSRRVIAMLARLTSVHGAPTYLRSDNGPDFVSAVLLRWMMDNQIDSGLIDPGKPRQNGNSK